MEKQKTRRSGVFVCGRTNDYACFFLVAFFLVAFFAAFFFVAIESKIMSS
jgi:hypothetical protein